MAQQQPGRKLRSLGGAYGTAEAGRRGWGTDESVGGWYKAGVIGDSYFLSGVTFPGRQEEVTRVLWRSIWIFEPGAEERALSWSRDGDV